MAYVKVAVVAEVVSARGAALENIEPVHGDCPAAQLRLEADTPLVLGACCNLAETQNPTTGGVEGFSFGEIADSISGAKSGVALPTGVSAGQMPVNWLYVLKGGQIIAPDTTSATTATFTSAITKPTSANPIVGKYRFLDRRRIKQGEYQYGLSRDLCVVRHWRRGDMEANLFRDTPRAYTYAERALGKFNPSRTSSNVIPAIRRQPISPPLCPLP